MKLAFLPNYFKKIAIICFICSMLGYIAVVTIATIQGLSTLSEDVSHSAAFNLGYEMGRSFATEYNWIIKAISLLLLLSMVFYMLAKEKVDDEYMDAMRWQSLRLALLISIAVTILFAVLQIDLAAKAILYIQFAVYLITFKVKKSKIIES